MNQSILLHFIKKAYREMIHFRLNTLVNLLGLTLGISACLLIGIYLRYELSFDRFQKDYENTYRLTCTTKADNGEIQQWAMAPSAYPKIFKDAFPEVENSARVLRSANHSLVFNENKFKTNYIAFADSSFFDIMEYPLSIGNPKTALNGTNQIILTYESAQKLFGNENPLNKVVSVYDDRGDLHCTVTGVLTKNIPPTHLNFEAILSYDGTIKLRGAKVDQSVSFIRVYDYFKLKEGTNQQEMVDKFNTYLAGNYPDVASYLTLGLQPIKSIHLGSNLSFDTKNGTKTTVYWLGIIGFIVLIMACVNYINLTSTEAIKHHKSTAISKILGATKHAMFITQFIKACLILGLASMIALALTVSILPTISQIIDIKLNFQNGLLLFVVRLLLILILVAAFFVGAFSSILTRIQQTDINLTFIKRSSGITKPLVVFQFLTTIVLLSGTFVIYKQFRYISHTDLGFSLENKIKVNAPVQFAASSANYMSEMISFKEEALQLPGVNFVSSSYVVPGQEVPWDYIKRTINGEEIEVPINMNYVDYDFFQQYNFKLLAGEIFKKEKTTNNDGMILNKQAIDALGFKSANEAIGQVLNLYGTEQRIIGVFENYHQLSLKQQVAPCYIKFDEFGKNNYTIGVDAKNKAAIYHSLEKLWGNHFPNDPFDGVYLADFYNHQYKKDYIFSKVFATFCILSVFISMLGIFILSISMAHQKTKEIGIRKVNGAKITEILQLLNGSFLKWVAIAFVLATPIAYYAMNKWLENFAYKTELSWWVFALAGVVAMVIALITVSWQSWKAATRNPVEALRYE